MKRFFVLLFAPCDRITGLVSESLDRELSRTELFAMRLHLLYCTACRRFRKQIQDMREALRDADHAIPDPEEWKLSPEARNRISKMVESD